MPITTTFHDFVASKIQAARRRALDRRAFLERRRAVVVIQSRFRRNARREKVRVSVRAFSSGEATTRPKTEASLEPSPTRARASPRLRSRERTTPRRDTTRGGVRRRLQNLSRPNADSTTGSVEHALTHHSPRPALHARLTRALLASLSSHETFSLAKNPRRRLGASRAPGDATSSRARTAPRATCFFDAGAGRRVDARDAAGTVRYAGYHPRRAARASAGEPGGGASGGRPRRVRPRAPEAGRASRGNAASRAVFAAERVLPRVHAPPGGRPQRALAGGVLRGRQARRRGVRAEQEFDRSRVWNTRARNPDGFRTRTRTRRIDTCVSSATTGALYPREPRERWPRTSACRRRRRSRPCPGFLILGAARLSTAKAPRRESSRVRPETRAGGGGARRALRHPRRAAGSQLVVVPRARPSAACGGTRRRRARDPTPRARVERWRRRERLRVDRVQFRIRFRRGGRGARLFA